MKFIRNLKLFFYSIFFGLKEGDKMVTGQASDSSDKTIPIVQLKQRHNVAQNLLKGEITQEVKELRYSDYLVSEESRNYVVSGSEATKTKRKGYEPQIFGGLNHEICGGIASDTSTYTLKFAYVDVPRFDLSKYCTQFNINLKNMEVILHFSKIPNKNISTSKAFMNYLGRSFQSASFGGELSKIKEMSFVTYKIADMPNFIKFTFRDLILREQHEERNEILLNYKFSWFYRDNLIEKYKVTELEEKYKQKAPKLNSNTEIEVENYVPCEICGTPILMRESELHYELCNKRCCNKCYEELIYNENLNSK